MVIEDKETSVDTMGFITKSHIHGIAMAAKMPAVLVAQPHDDPAPTDRRGRDRKFRYQQQQFSLFSTVTKYFVQDNSWAKTIIC